MALGVAFLVEAGLAAPKPAWKNHDLGLLVLSTGTWTS
jgi:hypothetical protein